MAPDRGWERLCFAQICWFLGDLDQKGCCNNESQKIVKKKCG
jgi:hypothetical protein